MIVGHCVSDMKDVEGKRHFAKDLDNIAFMTSHKVRGPIATMVGLVRLLDIDAIENGELPATLEKFRACLENLDTYSRELSAFVAERQGQGGPE